MGDDGSRAGEDSSRRSGGVWGQGTMFPSGSEAQYSLAAEEEIPVVCVLVLSGAPVAADPEFLRMSLAEAAAGIAVNTVTLGLFDRGLLARHLQFATDLAAAVPFWRVTYPHRREAIARVAQHLAESC